MAEITPFLWFEDKAEEAARFYVSLFKNSNTCAAKPSGRFSQDVANLTGVSSGTETDCTLVLVCEGTGSGALVNRATWSSVNRCAAGVVGRADFWGASMNTNLPLSLPLYRLKNCSGARESARVGIIMTASPEIRPGVAADHARGAPMSGANVGSSC